MHNFNLFLSIDLKLTFYLLNLDLFTFYFIWILDIFYLLLGCIVGLRCVLSLRISETQIVILVNRHHVGYKSVMSTEG